MTSLLLIISFILHIIALTAIFQLFKQLQSNKQNNSRDIVELLDTYLEEIKEENRLLEEKIDNRSSSEPANITSENQSMTQDFTENHPYKPPLVSKDADEFEASMQSQILHLYNKGLAVDDIAKKINCGKTEAALIIKMRKKDHYIT